MKRLARWHVWLGWLVAVPILLWTFTGLWMVARPIDEVRGTHLRAEPAALAVEAEPVLPKLDGRTVARLELAPRIDRTVWIVRFADGDARAADPATGALLPRIDASIARAIADAALVAPGEVTAVRAFAANAAPIDLRRERPSWQVVYAEGLYVYVDALTGELLAVRSAQWRWFDLMWGLHIMDVQTREDTSHPLLIGFAALAFIGSVFGTVLLFRRRGQRGSAALPPQP